MCRLCASRLCWWQGEAQELAGVLEPQCPALLSGVRKTEGQLFAHFCFNPLFVGLPGHACDKIPATLI